MGFSGVRREGFAAEVWGGVLMVVAVWVVFGSSVRFDFINYDDPAYVYQNEEVSKGVTVAGVRWAMTGVGETNLWHPVTWCSHMLDVEVFGLEHAGGHHAVSVFWHGVASVGLFLLLRRLTGSVWMAFFLALVWAVHPQRVQSVAWISERKDVLSGAFLFWSWWSWEKSRDGGKREWYGVALLLFVLAGLSKPSVVPLPAVLLLREVLRGGVSVSWASVRRLVLPVLPFVLVSAAVAGLTVYFQRTGGMADLGATMPLGRRVMLMPMGLWWYLENTVWPVPGKFWVYPPAGTVSELVVPVLGLLCVFGAVVLLVRRERLAWLGVGSVLLFWFPVSGVVPVSFYYVADRYSYLIQIGLLLVLAAVVSAAVRRLAREGDRKWITATAVVLVMLASLVTWGRLGHWRDSEALFSHERSINPRSLLAPIQLGKVREDQGRVEEALALYQEAMGIDKESGLATTNAARMLEKLGRKDEAMATFRAATRKRMLRSEAAFVHLSRLMVEGGDFGGAEAALVAGMERFPGRASLMAHMGSLALEKNDKALALEWYEKALAKEPHHADAMQGKAVILLEAGRVGEARELLTELLKYHPERQAVRQFLERLR